MTVVAHCLAMQPYSNLRVVDQARGVIKATYAFTRTLPRAEQFGLSSQMRRSAVSIGLNIVEGSSRPTTKEFLRFLHIARGSGMELHFSITVCADLGLGAQHARGELSDTLASSQKQLSALITSLRKRMAAGTRR
jgi:four helix bundle protein